MQVGRKWPAGRNALGINKWCASVVRRSATGKSCEPELTSVSVYEPGWCAVDKDEGKTLGRTLVDIDSGVQVRASVALDAYNITTCLAFS